MAAGLKRTAIGVAQSPCQWPGDTGVNDPDFFSPITFSVPNRRSAPTPTLSCQTASGSQTWITGQMASIPPQIFFFAWNIFPVKELVCFPFSPKPERSLDSLDPNRVVVGWPTEVPIPLPGTHSPAVHASPLPRGDARGHLPPDGEGRGWQLPLQHDGGHPVCCCISGTLWG